MHTKKMKRFNVRAFCNHCRSELAVRRQYRTVSLAKPPRITRAQLQAVFTRLRAHRITITKERLTNTDMKRGWSGWGTLYITLKQGK